MTNQHTSLSVGRSGEGPRQLAEALARYLNPDAFDGRLRARRDFDTTKRARQSAIKQARAAIRFFAKPGNYERLLATQPAQATDNTISEETDRG